MLAVIYPAIGARPELQDVPAPTCPADGVVVAVAATGVCRSDWHAWRGHDPVALPHIGGHELAGTVIQVGRAVTTLAVGDRVTTPFVNGCGRCALCAAGQSQVCADQTQPGFTGPGSFAERVALHAADLNVVQLPSNLGFVEAAALGCRFATAYRALTARAQVQPGEWLAVFGCGGVGLSAVLIGRALGARVIGVDPSPTARRRAFECGSEVVLAPEDAESAIIPLTDGGAHVAVDALGSPVTAQAGVRSLRRQGRHVQVGLLLGADAGTSLPMDRVVAYELQILGSHGMAARDYPAMLELVGSGAVDLSRLLGPVIGLPDVPDALAAMDRAESAHAGITVVSLLDGPLTPRRIPT